MTQHDRRTILKQAVAGMASLSTFNWMAQSKAAGANEKVVMGAIGCGGQGTGLLKSFAEMKGVELAYVCDPDTEHANNAAKEIEKISGKASPSDPPKDFDYDLWVGPAPFVPFQRVFGLVMASKTLTMEMHFTAPKDGCC